MTVVPGLVMGDGGMLLIIMASVGLHALHAGGGKIHSARRTVTGAPPAQASQWLVTHTTLHAQRLIVQWLQPRRLFSTTRPSSFREGQPSINFTDRSSYYNG